MCVCVSVCVCESKRMIMKGRAAAKLSWERTIVEMDLHFLPTSKACRANWIEGRSHTHTKMMRGSLKEEGMLEKQGCREFWKKEGILEEGDAEGGGNAGEGGKQGILEEGDSERGENTG